MQIVSNGNNLREMSNLLPGKKRKNIINLSSVELAQRVVKVKYCTPENLSVLNLKSEQVHFIVLSVDVSKNCLLSGKHLDPDQMPCSVASDLGLRCLHRPD